ncbi:MAG: DUF2871 domain-containing protein [Acholeplasmatales bacterium]
MSKYLNFALGYAIAAMVGGVFYREFTKWNEFNGVTMLGKVHVHLFLLGMVMFLIVARFDRRGSLSEHKSFRGFLVVYNIGLPIMVIMMVVRGILEVLNVGISKGIDSAISGVAGLGHILVSVGIILLLVAFKKKSEAR